MKMELIGAEDIRIMNVCCICYKKVTNNIKQGSNNYYNVLDNAGFKSCQ